MYSSLPKIEIYLYLLIIVVTTCYIMWHIYLSGNILHQSESLVPGWKLFNRLKDVTDYEWGAWKLYITTVLPWLVFQIVLSQLCYCFFTCFLPYVHFSIAFTFVLNFLGLKVALQFLFCALIFYLSSFIKSKIVTWFIGIFMLILNTNYLDCDDSFSYEICLIKDVSLAWFILKSIDFSLFSNEVHSKQKLLNYIAYNFYFPTFIFGPFMPFEDFCRGLQTRNTLTFEKCKQLITGITKFCFWAFVLEIMTHFFYCNVLRFNLSRYILKNNWSLNGVGFCLSQFFFLKYFVIYGVGSCVARFEGFNSPPPPKCVMRVHLYSKMWRYFDRGYYLFTVNCIYKPACKTPNCSKFRKFIASMLCFGFVFMWHGMNKSVFLWTLFNYLGITLEAFGRYVGTLPKYDQFVKSCSPHNVRRISCIFMAPVWILAVLSNFFFFGGRRYGFLLIDQIFNFNWQVLGICFIIAYCICQVAVEVENYESKHKKVS